MLNRNFFFVTTALVSSCVLSGAAFGADLYVVGEPTLPTVLPAVSGINGKIAVQGGAFEDEGFGLLTGSVSVPLGTRFGLQADGMAGAREGDFVGGGGAHLFWRDPSYGLLGVYGSYTRREDFDGHVARLGVEGEYYYNNWTIRTVLGAESIDAGSAFVEPDDGFFAFTDVSYYIDENLELSVGHRFTADRNALALGAEYQLDQSLFNNGVSLFAEGRIGEDDYSAVWAGVRVYFGDDKSLMRRHREDDPVGWGDEDLFDVAACDRDSKSCGSEGID
ncbi:hypothetical protein [Pararhizobium sp. IMCC21322]|uniref:hypothetical protein n=1 Tax=Pararhizobium sp. IMCC21322 TaxID=3067903 RepID=UPI002741A7C2|nr:hypothetical protein [Pararhizobium sp. IMCC21322]